MDDTLFKNTRVFKSGNTTFCNFFISFKLGKGWEISKRMEAKIGMEFGAKLSERKSLV